MHGGVGMIVGLAVIRRKKTRRRSDDLDCPGCDGEVAISETTSDYRSRIDYQQQIMLKPSYIGIRSVQYSSMHASQQPNPHEKIHLASSTP